MTTTGALTADAALALRAEEPRHEVKQEFRELSGEGCFKRNADFQQMMSLIINTRDVKGTDKEAKERKEHRQRQERRAQPTADKKSTANNRLKNIPDSKEKKRAYPTAGEEHTQPQDSVAHQVTEQKRGEVKRDAGTERACSGWCRARQLPCDTCVKYNMVLVH